MAFYKSFQTNNNKTPITKSEARKLISESYGERNADRHMETLLREKVFGLSYWMLFYEPTVDTYCEDQGCTFPGESCGYYSSQCIVEKYGKKEI